MLINDLYDDCLYAIFSRLPIREFLLLKRVCSRWNSLHQRACFERRSLTLVMYDKARMGYSFNERAAHLTTRIKKYWQDHDNVVESPTAVWTLKPDFDRLEFNDDFPIEVAIDLVKCFPNIRSLQICHYGEYFRKVIEQLIYLLTCWSSQLVRLDLWRHGMDIDRNIHASGSGHFYRILHCVNSMSSLRFLSIDTDGDQLQLKAFPVKISILSKLETFYLLSSDKASVMLDSLVEYAQPNDNLQQIRLKNCIGDAATLDRYLSLDKKFASKFVNLYVRYVDPKEVLSLSRLARHFRSLTCLWISISNLSVGKLAHYLRPLVHLTQLGLKIVHQNEINLINLKDESDNEETNKDQQQLTSVRGIELSLKANSHDYPIVSQLACLFPNLMSMRVFNQANRCLACGCLNKNLNDKDRIACIGQLLAAWKQCKHIRTVQCTYGAPYMLTRDQLGNDL